MHPPVTIVEPGPEPLVTTLPKADAVVFASSHAGFPIRTPSYLPPGYWLSEIDLDPFGAPPYVLLKFRLGMHGFSMRVSNTRYSVDEDSSLLIWQSTDFKIYKNGELYTVATPEYVAELTAGMPNPLDDGEWVKVLVSLVLPHTPQAQ